MREKIKEYAGPANVMCLEALAQPLVSEMQTCIRWQHRRLEQAAGAIEHALVRIGSVGQVRYHMGACTETFERLTGVLAEIRGLPADQVRNDVIPGSAVFHRKTEVGL